MHMRLSIRDAFMKNDRFDWTHQATSILKDIKDIKKPNTMVQTSDCMNCLLKY